MIDNISISLIKPVAEYIASSLTHVINSQILKQKFVKKWEMSYTKNDLTWSLCETNEPYQFFPYFQKSMKRFFYHKWQPIENKLYYVININLDIWGTVLT